jgi:Flp pilus assembly protein TadG
MRSIIEIPKPTRSLLRDERGSVAIIFGAALLPLIFFTGAALDYSRVLHAKTVMQAAADAAVVAAANHNGDNASKKALAATVFYSNAQAHSTPSANQAVVTPKLDANGQAHASGDVTFTTPTRWGTMTTTVGITASEITVKPRIDVATTFMKLMSINQVGVTGQAVAQGSNKKLEIAMMVDLTGSMSRNDKGSPAAPKINGLKAASVDFLNILFPGGATTSTSTRVAIVPFADYVNAGEYADNATGLAQTGGANSYSSLTNLASTRQGSFSGTYAGTFAGQSSSWLQASGGQAGATPVVGVPVGATPVAGNTFVSTHTATCNGGIVGHTGTSGLKALGPKVPSASSSGTPPAPATSASGGHYKAEYFDDVLGSGTQIRWQNMSDQEPDHNTSGYYVPMPNDISQVTYQMASGVHYGIKATVESVQNGTASVGFPNQIKKIGTDGITSYKKITGYNSSGWITTTVTTANETFIPIPVALPSTTVSSNCTAITNQSANSQLISCVTERTGGQAYTDAAPNSGQRVGAYNQGSNIAIKQNYSSDGKCWVAGRELPKVIPMTGTKSTLTNFFTNATVGGATPGHIGTAWAWYMVSPDWNSIFPTASAAVPYTDDQTIKAVVLMTDGEYNVHYATPAAATQALALCTAMKNKGVRVYTIGFGFGATAAADTTSEANARTMLTSCAGYKDATGAIVNTNSYFFPYDGTKLREHLVAIGNQLNTLAKSDIKVTQ